MPEEFKVYFRDLTSDCQARLVKAEEIDSIEEYKDINNWDVVPICSIPLTEGDENT